MLTQFDARVRAVRIFVSSTFEDMHEERDLLNAKPFNDLKVFCARRGVELAPFVDLRWGILEKECQEGKMIPICLQEVRACQPYFLCFLGERYGQVPAEREIDPKMLRSMGWPPGQIQNAAGKSVTELEILQALVSEPGVEKRCYFYLRNPKYLESIPKTNRRCFRESPNNPSSAVKYAKLNSLKKSIRNSEHFYLDNYPAPKAAVRDAAKKLQKAIADSLPTSEASRSRVIRSMETHAQYAQTRARTYFGIQDYLDHLDRHYISGGVLTVVSPAGFGKSSLLANWCLRLKQREVSPPLFLHFAGIDSASADVDTLLDRLLSEIQEACALDPKPLASTSDKIKELHGYLQIAGQFAKRRGTKLVIAIDALDQLRVPGEGNPLYWFPQKVPANVCVVFSLRHAPAQRNSELSGRLFECLEQREGGMLSLRPLKAVERKEMTERLLTPRKLPADQLESITESELCGNPLHLKLILNSLMLAKSPGAAGTDLRRYLKCAETSELFELILGRIEKVCTEALGDRSLAMESLSLLFVSRHGLTESELLELMRPANSELERLPRKHWSYVSNALHELLVNQDARLNYFHDEMRQAVERRYLTRAKRRRFHEKLADYFLSKFQEGDLAVERIDEELPWHLRDAENYDALASFITDPLVIRRFGQDRFWQLCELWEGEHLERDKLSKQAGKRLQKVELSRRAKAACHRVMGRLFNLLNHYDSSIYHYKHANRLSSSGNLLKERIEAKIGMADSLRERSVDYDRAAEAYDNALTLCGARLNYSVERSDAQFGLARISRLKGNHADALNHYQQAHDALQRLVEGDPSLEVKFAWRLFGLGEIHRLMWNLGGAGTYYNSALRKFRVCADFRGIAYCEWGLGEVNRFAGQFEAAKSHYKNSAGHCKKIGDRRSLRWAHLGKAETLRAQGFLSNDASLIAKSRNEYQQILSGKDKDTLTRTERAHTLLGLAESQRISGMNSISRYEEALSIYEENKMKYCQAHTWIGLALAYQKQKKRGANEFKEAISIASDLCHKMGYSHEIELLKKLSDKDAQLHPLNLP